VDLAKYESLISELASLESQIEILRNKYFDTVERNRELEVSVNELQQDKNSTQQKLISLDSELQQMKQKVEEKTNLNIEEREELKMKIKDLITKIDYRLSAERQG